LLGPHEQSVSSTTITSKSVRTGGAADAGSSPENPAIRAVGPANAC
jgi:hypothetical protein